MSVVELFKTKEPTQRPDRKVRKIGQLQITLILRPDSNAEAKISVRYSQNFNITGVPDCFVFKLFERRGREKEIRRKAFEKVRRAIYLHHKNSGDLEGQLYYVKRRLNRIRWWLDWHISRNESDIVLNLKAKEQALMKNIRELEHAIRASRINSCQ